MNPGEFDFEPIRGLPGDLPAGEHILWQGAPAARGVAIRILHIRSIAVYFAVILLWQAITLLPAAGGEPRHAIALVYIAALAAGALGFLTFVAWLIAKTTVYTITSRRVVLRFGMVFSVSINIPFDVVESTALHVFKGGAGDIPLEIAPGDHVAYLHLWPHARPWKLSHPQPMLRVIPDAARVAGILGAALRASIARPVPVPVRNLEPSRTAAA